MLLISKSSVLKAAIASLVASVSLTTVVSAQSAPGMSVTVEGLYLQRGDSPSGPAFMTRPSGSTTPVDATDPSNLDGDGAGGARIMAVMPVGTVFGLPRAKVELGAFWTGDLKGSMTYVGPDENHDSLYDNKPGNEFNTFNADVACCFTATLRTSLFGAEANVVVPAGGPGVTFFAGPRFISYREKLGARVYDDMFSYVGPGTNIDNIDLRVRNDLYGAQIGAEVTLPIMAGVTFAARVSGGLYANSATVNSTISDVRGFVAPLSKSYSSTEFAQGVEFLPTLTFDLTSRMSLNLGGQVLYLHNVAESANQFLNVADADARSVRSGGDVWFYGARAGITIKLD